MGPRRNHQSAGALPPNTRATRGTINHRQQPRLRFNFNVPVKLTDGTAYTRGERVGTSIQGYLGPVIEDRIPYLTTTSRADFMSAFNKRVNYHTTARIERNVRLSAIMMMRKMVPVVMSTIQWDTALYRDWLGQFDTEKQRRMEIAYENAGLENLSDYSSKQIFTKIESLVKDPETVAPRVIFKGTDYYNMVSGPMFKVLMDRFLLLQDSLPEVKFRVAYRQHTPEIVSFLESKKCASYIEADFSANDKSQVADVMQLEIMFMRRLGAPQWFLDLHRQSNKFSAYNSKYGVSAIVENQLPSGCTDGTFRNTFWNLTIFYTWARKFRVEGALACFLGDDMIAGLPRRVRRASRHYKSVASMARMEAKVTTSPSLHQCHFLSKHFVPVCRGENAHVMLPFIGKVLAKFNSRPNSNEAVSDDEYMAGKSLSHVYEHRYCKVLSDLFVERANYHLTRSSGKFSLEGVSYHVRVHSQYSDDIESMLGNADKYDDLVTADDLSLFWIGMADLSFSDLFPFVRRIILEPNYTVLDGEALKHLVDY
jgi:hypothetical protein